MNFKHAILFTLMLNSTQQFFGQTSEIHSGILHLAINNEETNLIKIHCVDLNAGITEKLIRDEFLKYSEEITSFEIRVSDRKLYVKYTNGINPNMILGILERVSLKAYYLNSNQEEVYFVKSGTENFKR